MMQRLIVVFSVVFGCLCVPANAAGVTPLSKPELLSLYKQIERCWLNPAGPRQTIRIRLNFTDKGWITSAAPINTGALSGESRAMALQTIGAIRRCQPYRLPAQKYKYWSRLDLTLQVGG